MAATYIDLKHICIVFLLWFFSAFIFLPFLLKRSKKPQRRVLLPPSPRAVPLIGHLHLLLSFPFHKTLQKLSSKHGPLLHLRVFNFPIVLVSSSSGAHDICRTQDVNFASRCSFAVEDSLVFSSRGLGLAPYGDYWRFMKKLTKDELLGQKHLERSRGVRREEFEVFHAELLEKAMRAEIVDVGKQVMKLSHNIICRMVMGRKCLEKSGEAEQVMTLINKAYDTSRKVIVGKAFRPFNSLFEKETTELSRRLDVLLEKISEEHEQDSKEKEHKDIMDVLLEAYHDENAQYKITRNHVKAFIVDMLMGGTDSSMIAVQWTMSELMNNPDSLVKLREEIDDIVGRRRLIRKPVTILAFLLNCA